MRKSAFVVALLALALPAMAQTMVDDADGDGVYSLAEMQAAYPDLSKELFAELDGDADGMISAEELAAAKEDGMIAE
ncbi:hypothetical protein [Aliiruegeria sabulilitoris]|uniref:hypothetical protein n=1 Tax=Aliiruegeria sabulilitoris TaxID=1510458 RepID=UPI00082D06E4|nr:hypothetical protein [Aliiruegeria sabulilitoris]NDR54947.1 EF-hand domain-containing protein [Pseudoruegeria sp. M32A2M]